MNTTIIVYKIDTTYGGYEYLEFDTESMEYALGNSRGHQGHSIHSYMNIEVKTQKELKKQIEAVKASNYRHIDTFAKFG